MGEMMPFRRFPRRRIIVEQCDGGWRSVVILADNRAANMRTSPTFPTIEGAVAIAEAAALNSGLPLDLQFTRRIAGPSEGGAAS